MLVKDFKEVRWIKVTEEEFQWAESKERVWKESVVLSAEMFPPGTRKLNTTKEVGVSESYWVQIGLPWTVEEFTNQALNTTHPFDSEDLSRDELTKAAFRIMTRSRAATKQKRLQTLIYYQQRAMSLEAEERKVHDKMAPDVKHLMKNKKLVSRDVARCRWR